MPNLQFDAYVIDVLMSDLVGHDHRPAAFIVYLCLLRHASRSRRDCVTLSLQDLAVRTGLSKSTVQVAIRHLRRRGLVASDAANEGSRRVLRPWLQR